MWEKVDDALKPFRLAPRGSRMFGYAGPPSAKAAEAYSVHHHRHVREGGAGHVGGGRGEVGGSRVKKVYEG
jgi:hypothetical protein